MSALTTFAEPMARAFEARAAAGRAHGLALSGVSKAYGLVRAVDRVSLDVAPGQFLTLLGPSGSGKTTLLMMIAGFVDPTEGDIRVEQRSLTGVPPERRNFGMVFQGYALFPHLSVSENVAFPLSVRRIDRASIAERVRAALDLVQLGHLADRAPRQLSGGQQQRVALARALVFEPDLLLLDEPLGALDRKLRAEVQIELKALHDRLGTTFIYVTHDQEEALSMSDRIAILRDGRLVQVGPPAELYERPATRFVAGFLGDSNFIAGTVERGPGGTVLQAGRQMLLHDGDLGEVGRPAVLALRPEKLIVSVADPQGQVNRVPGRVVTTNYYGSTVHLSVDTAIGRMAARVPAGSAAVRPGDAVWLAWEPSATRLVEDDGTAPDRTET